MTEMSLQEYWLVFKAGGGSQEALAKKLGVNQSAVSQMLRSDRDIYVTINGDTISAHEKRPIPARANG